MILGTKEEVNTVEDDHNALITRNLCVNHSSYILIQKGGKQSRYIHGRLYFFYYSDLCCGFPLYAFNTFLASVYRRMCVISGSNSKFAALCGLKAQYDLTVK